MDLLREGRIDEAAATILEVNPMPAVTGRVCPHFCEERCNRGPLDDPVSVRNVERFLGDHILAYPDRFLSPPAETSGKTVAVVGSGPSGLAAAWFLRRSGHRVAVIDRMEKPGGMLRYAIPSFRLPREIVDRVVGFLEALGVTFVLGVDIGEGRPASALLGEYDAVYTAGGAWAAPSIGLEGEKHTTTGLGFLAAVQEGKTAAPGKQVLVIGGGNVAVDAAVTAKRLGAEKVVMACLEKREEMPALDWEVQHALEEGIELLTSFGPSRVIVKSGRVTGAELTGCTSVFDGEGRFAPTFDPGRKHTVSCDAVILAVGQAPDHTLIEPGMETERGRIIVDPESGSTRLRGVFAGGDAVSGPATVVEAIAAGRRGARGINAFLETAEPRKTSSPRLLNRFATSALEPSRRQEVEVRPPEARTWDGEDAAGLSSDQVPVEADRCLNCGCVAVCPSDLAPVLTALEAGIVTGKRTIPAEDFFTAAPLSSTILDHGELVSGVFIPDQKELRTSYLKFRIRNAIDFPVASVAVALRMEGDAVQAARIVLGAAAPVPLRARRAEQVLEGKTPGEAEAAEAAEAAVKGAMPLECNAYKVNVLQALIKRAILKALE
jgi:NADPH-dependent glutamate synthase beta subunit-like oxidoreductase